MGSTDLIGAASVFDPCHLPETEDNLSGYGTEKIAKLTDFYGMKQKVKCDGQEGESAILKKQKLNGNYFGGLFSNSTKAVQFIKYCLG